jgi:dTDP-4-amino-4,6-dideoxy-D-galactose acyltransferase
MTPKFSWKKDLFDSEILGFPCAKIERLVNGKLTVEELIRDLKMNKIEYAVIRILGKDYVTAQLLESNGFRLVDSLVEMNVSLENLKIEKVNNIRIANANDSKSIQKISSNSFDDTRFFHEEVISTKKAKKIYAEWAKNSLLGKVADKVIVWEENGNIEGFATIQKSGHIPIIAVSKNAQGKGVGKSLCRQALNICKEFGAKNAAIETQSNNIAALRAYMASGFKITQSFFTFAWRER